MSKLSKAPDSGITTIIPSSAEQSAKAAKLEQTGLILERLTSPYSNPLEAAIRETYSNAQDATVLLPEADRRPVEILTPTASQPFLRITDHGVGMSPEDIDDFATYGKSEKLANVTQTGSYGVGGKAPLAYGSRFEGESVKDGVKTRFYMERRDSGIVYDVISTTPASEANGTSIWFEIENADFDAVTRILDTLHRSAEFLPHVVNGKLRDSHPDYILLPQQLLIHQEANLRGRVLMRRGTKKIRQRWGTGDAMGFALTGWLYGAPGDDEPLFIVELFPGIVDFDTGRTKMLPNSRHRSLERLIAAQFTDSFMRNALGTLMADSSFTEAMAIVYQLSPEISTGSLSIRADGYGVSTVAMTDMVSAEGLSVESLFKAEDCTVLGAFDVSGDTPKQLTLNKNTAAGFSANNHTHRWGSESSVTTLVESFARAANHPSVRNHLSHLLLTASALNSRSSIDNKGLTLIKLTQDGDFEKNVKSLLSTRRYWKEIVDEGHTVVFELDTPVEVGTEEHARRQLLSPNVPVASYSHSEFMKLVAETRRKAKESIDPLSLIATSTSYEPKDGDWSTIYSNPPASRVYTPLTFGELDKNTLVVVTPSRRNHSHSPVGVLKGLENAGLKKPYARIAVLMGLKQTDYLLIKDRTTVVFHMDFKPSGAKLVAAFSKNSYHARHTTNEVESVNRVDALNVLLPRYITPSERFMDTLSLTKLTVDGEDLGAHVRELVTYRALNAAPSKVTVEVAREYFRKTGTTDYLSGMTAVFQLSTGSYSSNEFDLSSRLALVAVASHETLKDDALGRSLIRRGGRELQRLLKKHFKS